MTVYLFVSSAREVLVFFHLNFDEFRYRLFIKDCWDVRTDIHQFLNMITLIVKEDFADTALRFHLNTIRIQY